MNLECRRKTTESEDWGVEFGSARLAVPLALGEICGFGDVNDKNWVLKSGGPLAGLTYLLRSTFVFLGSENCLVVVENSTSFGASLEPKVIVVKLFRSLLSLNLLLMLSLCAVAL